MLYSLRDYQAKAVYYVNNWLATAKQGSRLLLAAPTGSGKSIIEIAIQDSVPGSWIVTPKVEIIRGLLNKQGIETDSLSDDYVVEIAFTNQITTPIRLRNRLLAGGTGIHVSLLLMDESHHDLASTWTDLHLLCGLPPAIGFTATPYRGTPKGTAALREVWGDPVWIISYPEAVQSRVISIPDCYTIPFVDDDLIEVQSGELITRQVDDTLSDRIAEIAEWTINTLYDRQTLPLRWLRPTMFSFPSSKTALHFTTLLNKLGCPANCVTDETPGRLRQQAFAQCLTCTYALVQIQVVSEGIDLPIKVLVDCSPTLSPVKWLQQLGRITRPSEAAPMYFCTNRNLMRHSYLLEGCLPSSAYSDSETAFGGPSKRSAVRAMGLEVIGRLKSTELPLAGGLTGLCYCMSAMDGLERVEYFVGVHPLKAIPLWATRRNRRSPSTGEITYGRWVRCEPPNDITGFASLPTNAITDKQRAWWKRSAKRHGLNVEAEPTRKNFAALPVLSDLGARF